VDRVIFAHVDVNAWVPLGATLADDDVARNDNFATELLYAEALAARIATVFNGSLSFLMSHCSK
jgi:hypothetical protein